MHRSRAPSIAPGTFFAAQSWADCITNMAGFNLRQAQREKLRSQLIEPAPSTPDELRARMEAEKTLWADVIKASDIRIN
jgi:hypothetical protein